VVGDGRARESELVGDLERALAGEPALSDLRGRGSSLRFDGELGSGERGVLFAGGVGERDELVHLEESPGGLGHLDAHPPAAGGVALEVAVVDGFVEDRCQAGGELTDHRGAQRPYRPPLSVLELGAGIPRAAQLGGLLDLVRLEGEAELGVDVAEAVLPEERE
jgi:hypothetical protein